MGKTIVIKYGGSAMQSEELKAGVMEDVVRLTAESEVVLVHGGGPEISALQKRLGTAPRFVDGLRYTDEGTIETALMALCGKVNKDLVRLFENAGGKAAGISGIDGSLLTCCRIKEPDIGFVGEIREVRTDLISTLLRAGYTPIVSTIGLGDDGLAYNINADTAAGRIASSLSADFYVTISDVPGVLSDKDDPASLIPEIRISEIESMIESGVISGGMIPKVRGLAGAVRRGAGAAQIVDGRIPHVLGKCMAGSCTGTRLVNG